MTYRIRQARAKRRIAAVFLAGIAAIALICTILFAFYNRRMALERTLEYEMTVVDTLSDSIDSMNSTAQSLIVQLYSSPTAQKILNYNSLSDVELRSLGAQLSDYYFRTPYMYSYYLINSVTGRVCTRNGLYSFDSFADQELLEMLRTPEQLRPYQCIVRRQAPTADGERTNYFTYVEFDDYLGVKPTAFIVVNMSESWIQEKIRDVCKAEEMVLIFDETGDLILSNQDPANSTLELIRGSLVDQEGTFRLRVGNTNYVGLYSEAAKGRWRIVRMVPSVNIYRDVNRQIGVVAGLNLLVLGIFLLGYSIYAKRLLSSVDTLEKKLNTLESERNRVYPKLREAVRHLIGSRYLPADPTELQELIARYDIQLRLDGTVLLGLCRIDDYYGFCQRFDADTRGSLEFAVHNVAQDMLRGVCLVEGFSTAPGDILLIFSDFSGETEGTVREIVEKMVRVRAFVEEHLEFCFSMAFSDVGSLQDIRGQYDQINDLIRYRFYRGARCVLMPDDIASAVPVPMEQEWRLVQAISDGLHTHDYDSCARKISSALEEYKQYEISACLRLMEQVNALLREHIYREQGQESLYWDEPAGNTPFEEIERAETLPAARKAYLRLFQKLGELNAAEEKAGSSYRNLSDKVKGAIERDYANANLTLLSLADEFSFSSAYMGRIFRRAEGCSVSAYINAVRLEHVAEMLTHTDLSINEIASQCGVENTAYLYTLFKKRYFMTPSEYRAAHKQG